MAAMSESIEDLNLGPGGVVPVDSAGVDLSLIRYCLSLTPAQRLRNGQAFANWILDVRRRNGVKCATPPSSIGSNFSTG